MNGTKTADKIYVSPYADDNIKELRENYILEMAQKGIEDFEDLYIEIERIWEYEALSFEGTENMLYPRLNLILYGEMSSVQKGQEMLSVAEAYEIFFEYSKESRYHNYQKILCKNGYGKIGYITKDKNFTEIKNLTKGDIAPILKVVLNKTLETTVRGQACYHFPKTKTKLDIFVDYKLKPQEMEKTELLDNLIYLIQRGYLSKKDGRIELTESGIKAIIDGEIKKIGYEDLQKYMDNVNEESDFLPDIKLENYGIDFKKVLFKYYSECDKIRANMGEYDLRRLEDPNLGHWELWEGNIHPKASKILSQKQIYARNPEIDIKEDSIVGIDFGTKSTVVVFQDESGRIMPMPIGCGDVRKVLENVDFENPTVMQFIDINSFINDYSVTNGRPYTKWQDLIISHAANETMKETTIRSDEFYSYIYDLKQWAAEKNIKNIIKDKNGKTFLLKPYSEVGDNETNNVTIESIDPIELYAYYIGLYVNNMNNGIFLEYLLSFPVTYEKHVRDMIISSFKKGIWKSMPESLRASEDIRERFKVEAGTSEPAAYAICALEQYGFDPKEDEKFFYGIFDFGGGTADFDFGIWTNSDNEDVFDYKIEHFGSEGDQYLGGENLLQLIAFEVFKENIDLCRKEKIVFCKPIENIDVPVYLKGYVNDSQEARINLKLMMEKLRPFWERKTDNSSEDYDDMAEFSEFQISLFNTDGVLKSNLAFETDISRLDDILIQRISKGVRQFFNAMKKTFDNSYINKTATVNHVNIFLAGNSSKSPILKKIFQENINEWNSIIMCKDKTDSMQSYFSLFPPLGTSEAYDIQKERGYINDDNLNTPNGKTGVAWGLIEGRKGGRIQIVEEISPESEAKFAYYLGISKKKTFCMKISRDTEYMSWIRFIPAIQKKFEILYTSLPEATNGELKESDDGVLRKRLELEDYGEGKYIFIRLVGRDKIEFVVSTDVDSICKNNIVEITL